MDKKIVVLDTNILLHYKLPAEIDWCKILQAKEVEIVITRKVMGELNAHKDRRTSKWESKRAGIILRAIHSVLDNGNAGTIRPGVTLRLAVFNPSIEFNDYQLNKDVPDDWVLASAIELRDGDKAADVVVVTNDYGLSNTASSLGLEGVWWGDNDYRLPDELDPDLKRIRELEQENRRLRDRVPVLDIQFADGGQTMTLTRLSNPQEYFTQELDRASKQHKKLSVPMCEPKPETHTGAKRTIDIKELRERAKQMAEVVDGILVGARYKYNSRLDKFMKDFEEHLKNRSFYESQVVDIAIVLRNDGTCPADDVDIFVDFPPGTRLLDNDGMPEIGDEPQPPDPPVPGAKYEPGPFGLVEGPALHLPRLLPHIQRLLPNVRGPFIDGHHVTYKVTKIKHCTQLRLDPVYAVFDSPEVAKSFSCTYRIVADNVPDELNGRLSLVLKKVAWHEPSIEEL